MHLGMTLAFGSPMRHLSPPYRLQWKELRKLLSYFGQLSRFNTDLLLQNADLLFFLWIQDVYYCNMIILKQYQVIHLGSFLLALHVALGMEVENIPRFKWVIYANKISHF